MHERLFDKLCDVLDDIERKESKLTASDIQLIDWATHAKKSMLSVDKMMDGYSSRGRRRDSMGRYASDRGDEYMDHLHSLLDKAPDERTRQSIQRMIREYE